MTKYATTMGNFLCTLCRKQYGFQDRSPLCVEDEKEEFMNICDSCGKTLDKNKAFKKRNDYLLGTIYYKKTSLLFRLRKKLRRE
jgi:predicted amidophosphoribosyltransferase